MCGIIGYTGKQGALQILMRGLAALEYRGYDSCGIALSSKGVTVIKRVGKLCALQTAVKELESDAVCGIGHTRWATHGKVTQENAHPHTVGKTTLVHNGIIENYRQIEKDLAPYAFKSETDTERACCLLNELYEKHKDGRRAIEKWCETMQGSYAFVVMFEGENNVIYATRRGCPLIVGKGQGGYFATSDISSCALEELCRLEDGQIAVLRPERADVYSPSGEMLSCAFTQAAAKAEAPDKNGYPHFMLKEIYETPRATAQTVQASVADGLPHFEGVDMNMLKNVRELCVIGCGTAYHAGLCGVHFARELAGLKGGAHIASEYRYSRSTVKRGDLVIFISQSGETADTLACMRMCKERGAYTLGVVNAEHSSLACESDGVILTHAGRETAVASTKAYVCQLAALYLLILRICLENGLLTEQTVRRYTEILSSECPDMTKISRSEYDNVYSVAKKYMDAENMFFIGRGIDSVLCSEASLKLKEVSYIHSEAYPAGELKHGAISLITRDTPVFAIITDTALAKKTENNIKEVLARDGRVILLGCDDRECCTHIVCKRSQELFSPFAAAPLFQLYAYFAAILKGYDPDKPRNLAKSVTVE